MKLYSLTSLAAAALSVALLSSSHGIAAESVSPAMAPTKGALADAPAVYPVPQKMTKKQGQLEAKGLNYQNSKADKDALDALAKEFPSTEGGVTLLIGTKDDPALAQFAAKLPDVPESYVLEVLPDKVVIVGKDDHGTFYGVQTLLQLIQKKGKGISMPMVEIVDFPDIRFRGTVEGFYGKPWSFEDRRSQFEFYGKNKLNTYIYGPKDDPFHGFSTRWRESYPAEQAKNISELVKSAKKNKVNFVWAVHPGRDIQWNDADKKAAVKKFEAMYDLGVRSFAIFFDDIGGEGAKPEGQADFINFLNREFIQKKNDVTPLIMCQTQYWGSGGDYHDYLGEHLDKDVDVMWTGHWIVSDIKKKDIASMKSHLKRPVYVWWNFPVTDYVRHALLLGRTYGVETGTDTDMSGFVSNPMDKPEASKITLFGVADMTWNQKAYDSDKSWRDGIRKMFPECAEAMQTFADHNSDGGPSGHNYRKEESVSIAPALALVLEKVRGASPEGVTEAIQKVGAEFKRISQAPALIRQKANNPALIAEISPWLVSFEALGKAGTNSLQMWSELEKQDWNKATTAALNTAWTLAHMKEDAMKESQKINKITGDHWQKDIRTGTLLMRPAVEEILDTGAGVLLSKLANRPLTRQQPWVSSSLKNGLEKMLDDNLDSFYYCQELQKAGDSYGVDLGSPQEIKTVEIVMGRADGDHDAVHVGQLEISKDGKTWENLMPESKGLRVSYAGSGKTGRFVRYRSTHAGIPDGKKDVWTAFRDFRVNRPSVTCFTTDNDSFKTVKLEMNDKMIATKPVLEIYPLAPEQFVGIDIPSGMDISSVNVNCRKKDMSWAELEYTQDGKTWKSLPLKSEGEVCHADLNTRVKGVRLKNKSKVAQDITLAELKLNRPEGSVNTDVLLDARLSTYATAPADNQKLFIPSNFDKANNAVVLSDGSPAEVYVCGADDQWKKVGAIKNQKMTTFSLKDAKKPVKALGISSLNAENPAQVFEVIWK